MGKKIETLIISSDEADNLCIWQMVYRRNRARDFDYEPPKDRNCDTCLGFGAYFVGELTQDCPAYSSVGSIKRCEY